MNWRCRLGMHDFPWPPHDRPWSLWEDFNIECARGCDARQTRTCFKDSHWANKHPTPGDDRP